MKVSWRMKLTIRILWNCKKINKSWNRYKGFHTNCLQFDNIKWSSSSSWSSPRCENMHHMWVGCPDNHWNRNSEFNSVCFVCILVLPGGLSDNAFYIPTAVTGVWDFQQVLVVFKHLSRSTNTEKHFVIMFNPLAEKGGREHFRCMKSSSLSEWCVWSLCSDLQWWKYFSSPAVGWKHSVSELSDRRLPPPLEPLRHSQMSLEWTVRSKTPKQWKDEKDNKGIQNKSQQKTQRQFLTSEGSKGS